MLMERCKFYIKVTSSDSRNIWTNSCQGVAYFSLLEFNFKVWCWFEFGLQFAWYDKAVCLALYKYLRK